MKEARVLDEKAIKRIAMMIIHSERQFSKDERMKPDIIVKRIKKIIEEEVKQCT